MSRVLFGLFALFWGSESSRFLDRCTSTAHRTAPQLWTAVSPQLNPQLTDRARPGDGASTTAPHNKPRGPAAALPRLPRRGGPLPARLRHDKEAALRRHVRGRAMRDRTRRGAVECHGAAGRARRALELLRRRERAVCWEPFGARSQFLRRRWRRGPTTPDDAPRDGDDDDEPPRPWRYRELRTTAAGLVLDGGGEMNFTGVHRPFGGGGGRAHPLRVRRAGAVRVAGLLQRLLLVRRRGAPRRCVFPDRPPGRLLVPDPALGRRPAPALAAAVAVRRRARGARRGRGRREARRRLPAPLGRRRGNRRAGALDGRARRRPAPPRRAAGHEAAFLVRRPAARVPLQLGPGREHVRGYAAGAAASSPVSNARCVISDLFVEDGLVDAEFLTNVRSGAAPRGVLPPRRRAGGSFASPRRRRPERRDRPRHRRRGRPASAHAGRLRREGRRRQRRRRRRLDIRDDDESGDGSTPSRARTSTRRTRRTAVARPASFAESVDDDVDVDEAELDLVLLLALALGARLRRPLAVLFTFESVR